tara:strand:- start:28 stop:489 length:462 start_codon:yes stop_codon:yes gene_type:complete
MKTIILPSLLLSLSLFLTKACYPVSHVIVGETQTPIDYTDVKVYTDYPDNYEEIAIMEASSDLSYKDLSIEFTHQQKTNKALERLKKEAALLGANGVVIQKISTNIKQHLSLNENDKGEKGKGKRRKGKSDTIGRERRTEKQKELNAIAIFVK